MDRKTKPEVLTNEELATVAGGGTRRRFLEPGANGPTFKFGAIDVKFAPLYDVSAGKIL